MPRSATSRLMSKTVLAVLPKSDADSEAKAGAIARLGAARLEAGGCRCAGARNSPYVWADCGADSAGKPVFRLAVSGGPEAGGRPRGAPPPVRRRPEARREDVREMLRGGVAALGGDGGRRAAGLKQEPARALDRIDRVL